MAEKTRKIFGKMDTRFYEMTCPGCGQKVHRGVPVVSDCCEFTVNKDYICQQCKNPCKLIERIEVMGVKRKHVDFECSKCKTRFTVSLNPDVPEIQAQWEAGEDMV